MKTLHELVKEEAYNIKLHATPDEIESLDFDYLKPLDGSNCIYGQMTGSCFSYRALCLIRLCGKPYSSDASKFIEPSKDNFETDDDDRDNVSAIEYYIPLPNAKNENLINYIKGKTQTLEL